MEQFENRAKALLKSLLREEWNPREYQNPAVQLVCLALADDEEREDIFLKLGDVSQVEWHQWEMLAFDLRNHRSLARALLEADRLRGSPQEPADKKQLMEWAADHLVLALDYLGHLGIVPAD